MKSNEQDVYDSAQPVKALLHSFVSLRNIPVQGLRLLAISFFLSSCTVDKTPLPPGFETLHLQMPLAQLKEQRPSIHPDGPARQYDPVGKIAFSVANQEVVGIRIFVAAPTDKLVLTYYSRNFAADRKEGHSYEIHGKLRQRLSHDANEILNDLLLHLVQTLIVVLGGLD